MDTHARQLYSEAPDSATPNLDEQHVVSRITVLEALAEVTPAISPNRSNASTHHPGPNDPDPDDQ